MYELLFGKTFFMGIRIYRKNIIIFFGITIIMHEWMNGMAHIIRIPQETIDYFHFPAQFLFLLIEFDLLDVMR